jgi:hypothetical protein
MLPAKFLIQDVDMGNAVQEWEDITARWPLVDPPLGIKYIVSIEIAGGIFRPDSQLKAVIIVSAKRE